MRKLLPLTVLFLVLAGNSGCMGTVAKRAFSEVAGASAKALPVPGLATSRFAQFQGVKINPAHSDLGGLVSARFTGALSGALREALVTGKDAAFTGGSPTMEIDPVVTFYSEAGGLSELMGSDSYAVVLYTLSADGAPFGKVQVVTKTAAARTGDEDLAKASAKGLAQFFEKYGKKASESRKKAKE
jgi:hypothetical protein